MPLKVPEIDGRKYKEILDEALRRIPVHNPEWTNFNESDPGITILEVFAFLTESLLYRCNQIPERNRRKFLSLLGLPLMPASPACGIVAFSNDKAPLTTLNSGIELRAGDIPFLTEQGLDVLPVEGQVYYKRKLTGNEIDDKLKRHFKQLYASYRGKEAPVNLTYYETTPMTGKVVSLSDDTVDCALWLAILARPSDKDEKGYLINEVRNKISGKTLNIGIVPEIEYEDVIRRLSPGGRANPEGRMSLEYKIPKVPDGGKLPDKYEDRIPEYKTLDVRAPVDVLREPGVVQITLPPEDGLILWNNLDPLEQGVGGFPPAIEDDKISKRIITWICIQAIADDIKLRWLGINAVPVTQRVRVNTEHLPDGTGEPDQKAFLAKTPVIIGSVRLNVNGEEWKEIDDIYCASSELEVRGKEDVKVFKVDPESGEIRFGDGLHGMRPPRNATMGVTYDYCMGSAGNVNEGMINSGPELQSGIKVRNPFNTWGGVDAEQVSVGEKHIPRYLQHRDRLVSASDFETIIQRTPGVEVGRVEVLPAFNPDLPSNEPGDAPGAVTIMVIPKYNKRQHDAPSPDKLFLNTICEYIESRRLVTTEIFLRGPVYKKIWISIGFNVTSGKSVGIAEVREEVKKAVLQFLSPLPAEPGILQDDATAFLITSSTERKKGWPLRKSVDEREISTVVSRVSGVAMVHQVIIGDINGDIDVTDEPNKYAIEMKGLELPWVAGISVSVGEAVSLKDLMGKQSLEGGLEGGEGTEGGIKSPIIPVPIIPEECK